jgi:hypothetical protein
MGAGARQLSCWRGGLDALVANGIDDYSREQLERDYRLSVLAYLFPPVVWEHPGAQQGLHAFDDGKDRRPLACAKQWRGHIRPGDTQAAGSCSVYGT